MSNETIMAAEVDGTKVSIHQKDSYCVVRTKVLGMEQSYLFTTDLMKVLVEAWNKNKGNRG